MSSDIIRDHTGHYEVIVPKPEAVGGTNNFCGTCNEQWPCPGFREAYRDKRTIPPTYGYTPCCGTADVDGNLIAYNEMIAATVCSACGHNYTAMAAPANERDN